MVEFMHERASKKDNDELVPFDIRIVPFRVYLKEFKAMRRFLNYT